MKVQDVLNMESISKLNNIQNDISFEEAYDKGLEQLKANRMRLLELKKMKDAERFLYKKKHHA